MAALSSTNVRLCNTNSSKFSSFFAEITVPADTISDIKSTASFKVGDVEDNINDSDFLSALFLAKGKLKN